jgi:predicted AAA+ superfamily ATPase
MSFKREFNVLEALKAKSHFLLGPRGTGKSFLARQQLEGHAAIINLLRSEASRVLLANPSRLESMIAANIPKGSKFVVIDEVQKIPALLDEVHRLIEEGGYKFLLTGSSARKLRTGGVNLLAGRAWPMGLFPLTTSELGAAFQLDQYLRYGGLPSVISSDAPQLELDAYVGLYLDEEIKMEGLVRRLAPFSEFLRLAGLSNGKVINFSKMANEVGVSSPTIREYFHILEDTLVGNLIPLWRKSPTRKPGSSARFYFFDTGVANTLAGINALDPASDLFGRCFEQFVYMEIKAWMTYRRKKFSLSYWQKSNECEVDLLLGNEIAIEVKSTTRLNSSDFRGLKEVTDEVPVKRRILVSRDPMAMENEGILCLHWSQFCERLWNDNLV